MVELYTSLSGAIGYPCPPYAYPNQRIPLEDTASRYRLLRVDGIDPDGGSVQVVGFFEPVPGLPRGHGTVAVFRNWKLENHSEPFVDDTMIQHLKGVLAYFSGQTTVNPYSAEQALHYVFRLNAWAREGWFDMSDSDEEVAVEALSPASSGCLDSTDPLFLSVSSGAKVAKHILVPSHC